MSRTRCRLALGGLALGAGLVLASVSVGQPLALAPAAALCLAGLVALGP